MIRFNVIAYLLGIHPQDQKQLLVERGLGFQFGLLRHYHPCCILQFDHQNIHQRSTKEMGQSMNPRIRIHRCYPHREEKPRELTMHRRHLRYHQQRLEQRQRRKRSTKFKIKAQCSQVSENERTYELFHVERIVTRLT